MDKRSFLFVLALSATLFLVNTYFERQNQETVRQWREENRGKALQKIEQLKEDIASHTRSVQELPIVALYADPEEGELLTQGLLTEQVILTLFDQTLPEELYSNGKRYKRAFQEAHGLSLYQSDETDKLRAAPLPIFGTFDLQMLSFSPPQITLGRLIDGNFSRPAMELQRLQKEWEETDPPPIEPLRDGIALIEKEGVLVPAALYLSASDSLVSFEQIIGLPVELIPEKKEPISEGLKEERLFVLENGYQQLVFSNWGGALAEINLPFEGKEHPNSIVKEIAFDREMVEQHPANAHFPSRPYYMPGKAEEQTGTLGGYYPLIRRNLVRNAPFKSIRILPRDYALNIVSEYPETAEMIYTVKELTERAITFERIQPHRRITKTFRLPEDPKKAPYIFDLEIQIEGDARGLWITSGVPEVEWISNGPAPALKYRVTRKNRSEVVKLDLPSETTTISSVSPDWICNSNGFFGLILDPLETTDAGMRFQKVSGATVPSRLLEIDREENRFQAKALPGYLSLLPLKARGGTMRFRIYAGPFADETLNVVDATFSNPETGYNPDYIASQSFHGWFAFISAPFAKFLFILMKLFHALTGSWAFSIILLTVALRLMLYPLNAWSTKSMIKMREIAPQVTQLQEKYKDNKSKMQLEIMNLYRDSGVNPLSGCFPLIIQMPFLFGMFDLLKSTFALRGASFIPGWIDDLAAPDVLFSWETPIFFIGNQFHLLPFLLGGVMFLQQWMLSPHTDASQMSEQQRQQKAMGNIMSLVFTLMFYHFPSGLNIYWLSSMLLGIIQQKWTQMRLAKQKELAKVEIIADAPKQKRRRR